MFNLERARYNMIEQQIRPWDVLDQAVLKTIGFIPREQFVPLQHKKLAFADVEIPLGHGEYMMNPRVEARLLQALAIGPHDTCLEIGTGSGFVTACMAHLSKHVDSVEIHEDFIRQAEAHLAANGLKHYTLHHGDALRDWSPPLQAYDVIAVTGSLPSLMPRFETLLAPGGRLFMVVGTAPVMQAMLVQKQEDGEMVRTTLFETRLAPLVGAESDVQPPFPF